MDKLGKFGRDKITGFSGIIVAKVTYLYGCDQYGITPKVGDDGKLQDTTYFDSGRIEISDSEITPESVAGPKPGPDHNMDCPKNRR